MGVAAGAGSSCNRGPEEQPHQRHECVPATAGAPLVADHARPVLPRAAGGVREQFGATRGPPLTRVVRPSLTVLITYSRLLAG